MHPHGWPHGDAWRGHGGTSGTVSNGRGGGQLRLAGGQAVRPAWMMAEEARGAVDQHGCGFARTHGEPRDDGGKSSTMTR